MSKKSHRVRDEVRAAQADHCARTLLIGLGVLPELLPPVSLSPLWEPAKVERAPAIKLETTSRFRRTNNELLELEKLTDWQKARRAGHTETFVLS